MPKWSEVFARPARPPELARPSLFLFFLLSGAFLLTIVPQAVEFPPWITACIVIALVIRAGLEFWRLPLPSTTFTGIIAVILLVLIAAQFGTIRGRDAGTAFTAGLLAIKFYELRRSRDVSLVIFSCFFLVMSALLFSQAVELFVYCMIMMWILTALLMRLNSGDQQQDHLLRMLGHSGLIFMQAVPLAAFLFFLFPRINGPIGLPLDDAPLGLTDNVGPGSIAKLSQNTDEAMYVHFAEGSDKPMGDSMYWRALVLWKYNRGAWTRGDQASHPASMVQRPDDHTVKQEVTVRAHHQKWLFALDVPVSMPINSADSGPWATSLSGHVLELSGPIKLDHIVRYTVNSSLTPVDDELRAYEQGESLDLPLDQIDPRVKQLADKLHEGLNKDQREEYVENVIHYFRHGGFVYTQSPGVAPNGGDWLPWFLFESKRGFCEHYASAFAILMRLEHVETRLVVGYFGADINPYTDTYTVTQSRAHAWTEVWIPDKNQINGGIRGHWKRYDPTALITAPDAATSQGQGQQDNYVRMAVRQADFSEKYLPAWARDLMKMVQQRREELETNWDDLVLSYDTETQNRLAQALGFGDRNQLGMLLSCLGAGAVCLFTFRLWMNRKPPIPPIEKLYAAFCRNMARRGIPRASWEGPLAYTGRVAEAFPEQEGTIHRVGTIVAQVRYGAAPDPAAPEELKAQLNLLAASNAAAASRDRR